MGIEKNETLDGHELCMFIRQHHLLAFDGSFWKIIVIRLTRLNISQRVERFRFLPIDIDVHFF